MAPQGAEVGTVLLVVAILSVGAMAQSDCTNVLISMASCLNYVTGSAATPPASCCSALANVVQTQPQCLCTIVNGGGSSLGVNINKTLALELPSACKVETPPASRCNGSPESSPPESPDGIPASPNSPSVTGSKTVPSSGTASNGNTRKMNVVQVAANVLLFITASHALAAFNNIF